MIDFMDQGFSVIVYRSFGGCLERMRGLKLKQAMAVATQKAMGRLRMSGAVMAWSCRNSSTRPFLKFAWAMAFIFLLSMDLGRSP